METVENLGQEPIITLSRSELDCMIAKAKEEGYQQVANYKRKYEALRAIIQGACDLL